MGKICKYANLYDKDGNLIHKVNEQGVLENYSMEELESLLDSLVQEDNKGNDKSINYINGLLMMMYAKYGNPHEEEILAKLKEQYGDNKSTQELVAAALKDLAGETQTVKPTVMDEYIEPIEEIKDVEQQGGTEPNNA